MLSSSTFFVSSPLILFSLIFHERVEQLCLNFLRERQNALHSYFSPVEAFKIASNLDSLILNKWLVMF